MDDLPIVLVLTLAVLALVVRIIRGDSALEKWASENNYRLLDKERRYFRRGPFFFSGRAQKVYWVTVDLPDGQVRNAWVRTGGFFLGSLSSNVDVQWDQAPPYRAGFPVVMPDEGKKLQ